MILRKNFPFSVIAVEKFRLLCYNGCKTQA